MKCRHCGEELSLLFIDLGSAPPSNAYLTAQSLHAPEKWFPLRVLVCSRCWLVQTEDYSGADDLFSSDYAYFSSYSTTWLQHSEHYVVDMIERFGLNATSHVVEIAANDGYLLQYVKARGIPCLGVEPTASTASAARSKGIEIVQEFFSVSLARTLAKEGKQADLMVANNVLAHVPNINDFVAGFAMLLKPGGIATFEFPHLLRLVAENQFDTIYHEHFSYFSLSTVSRIFSHNGLAVFDVEELPTHGGSLRIYVKHKNDNTKPIVWNVKSLLDKEAKKGMNRIGFYTGFHEKANRIKYCLLKFLIEQKDKDALVVAYGAAAKGNTLLNYCGIKKDLIRFVVDASPYKQGMFLPGSHIPVVPESEIRKVKPNYVLILPWNIKDEIMNQLGYIREWDAKFVVPIPEFLVL